MTDQLSHTTDRVPVEPDLHLRSFPPLVPDHWIRRPRLDALLDGSARAAVTFVSGAPGAGKTSLVAGWRALWLHDRMMWQSARSGDPVAGLRSELDLSLDGSPAGLDLRPLVAVIDDSEVIDTCQATALEDLAVALPKGSRLIIVGRDPGAISMSRLCLRTEVATVTDRELRFTTDEAMALIAHGGHRELAAEDARLLVERTQGWAVGLRFASLLLSETPDAATVAERLGDVGGPMWEYIDREVMGALSEDDRRFLCAAAVAETASADLCEAVTGRSDARSKLESIAARHLLVSHERGDLFRFNPLMLAHLRGRREMEGGHSASRADLAAAEWFSSRGERRAAIFHYARAGRNDLAVEIGAEQAVDHLAAGEITRGHDLLPGDVPETHFAEHPLDIYALVASLLCASRLDQAAKWLRRLEIGLRADGSTARLRARASCLWAIHDSAALDSDGVLRHFEQAKRLIEGGAFEIGDRPAPTWLSSLDNAVLTVLPWMVAQASADSGRPDEAMQMVEHHDHRDRRPNGHVASASLAAVALAAGRLREAVAQARKTLDVAEGSWCSPVARIESLLVLSRASLERDQLDDALDRARGALQIALETGLAGWAMAARCDAASVIFAKGDARGALSQLRGLRDEQEFCDLPAAVKLRCSHLEFRCRLSHGDVEGARDVAELMPAGKRRSLDLARVMLSAGQPDRAASLLVESDSGPNDLRQGLEGLLLRARVGFQLGNPAAANQSVARAVDLARPERFVRVFVEEPRQIGSALADLRRREPDPWTAELAERCAADKGDHRPPAPSRMVEPLTNRERELVSFLPSHLTQYEIARQMFISANTVKTHMKGLYRKLGATSRSEAVDVARACGLL